MLGKKDNVLGYPGPKNTGSGIKDGIYNWVVKRYKKNNHPWKKSDEVVWGGFVYGVLDIGGVFLFVGIMYWLLDWTLSNHGFEKMIMVLGVILLVRVNILVRQIAALNKKF